MNGYLEEKEESEYGIPLAPLVDIVFLLLVFFLLTTTYLEEEKDLSLKLPRSSGAESGRALNRILINIRTDGTVLFGQAPVGPGELYRRLLRVRRTAPGTPVVVRADKAVPHGDVVSVISACKRAGLGRVAIAVEPEE